MLELRDEYIPDLVEQLDILAYNLATAVNAVHNSGIDQNSNSGSDFFSFFQQRQRSLGWRSFDPDHGPEFNIRGCSRQQCDQW